MKKFGLFLSSLVIIMGCLFLSGCGHDDEPTVEYYVRYTAICQPDVKVRMYFSNESGEKTNVNTSMPDGKFQYCVGPVKKGFKADLFVSYYDEGGYADFLSIEVAQGLGPFVLKEQASNLSGLHYIIE